jgi:hypothetical protein
MPKPKALVVGTTSDYIDWLRKKNPEQLFFLTDRQVRYRAKESQPGKNEELLCNLNDLQASRLDLLEHFREAQLTANAIICFDCEAMPLTALVARDFGLRYPSLETVHNCRDKHLAKIIWRQSGVHCPRTHLLQSEKDVAALTRENSSSWVLKPSCGSGSELVYFGHSRQEIENLFHIIQNELRRRSHLPLYRDPDGEPATIIAEEYISGTEYSVDFFLQNDCIEIIRLTEKIIRPGYPFGTIRGYCLIPSLPNIELDKKLHSLLYRGARALGLERALCMADFILQDSEPVLLEITPRPGGDCLPALLLAAGPLDILQLALDFSRPDYSTEELPKQFKPLAALRFHADQGGIIKHLESHQFLTDPRIVESSFFHKTGDLIRMPPEDYDTWILGNLIFEPLTGESLATQCHQLHSQLTIEIES